MKIINKIYFIKLVFILCVLFTIMNYSINVQADLVIKPLAIMVGNSAEEIIHQTGLSNADIVYEMNVEFPFYQINGCIFKWLFNYHRTNQE